MRTTAIDFARSFLWWRVDVDEVPPPYPVNNARTGKQPATAAPGGLAYFDRDPACSF